MVVIKCCLHFLQDLIKNFLLFSVNSSLAWRSRLTNQFHCLKVAPIIIVFLGGFYVSFLESFALSKLRIDQYCSALSLHTLSMPFLGYTLNRHLCISRRLADNLTWHAALRCLWHRHHLLLELYLGALETQRHRMIGFDGLLSTIVGLRRYRYWSLSWLSIVVSLTAMNNRDTHLMVVY